MSSPSGGSQTSSCGLKGPGPSYCCFSGRLILGGAACGIFSRRAGEVAVINSIHCDYSRSRTRGFCDVSGDGLSRQQRPLSTQWKAACSIRDARPLHFWQARIARDMWQLTHSDLVLCKLRCLCGSQRVSNHRMSFPLSVVCGLS
jgi:hypothetical protein